MYFVKQKTVGDFQCPLVTVMHLLRFPSRVCWKVSLVSILSLSVIMCTTYSKKTKTNQSASNETKNNTKTGTTT